ncbi:sulfite dehydrogenase (cytochrome) subunit [Azoarcus sp. KH32C]|uniref:SorB family sulfite dehydrogenase c-type cytochrome subunit n=1 Tax=Azoarcus sp. KH32C TaxID=748247 RepID=UPI000238696C|nr:sulfite dehydrogenase (cytochrome) subunit [Azoarcus sp. KH32C]BAL24823.1 sulfite dehydrogenase (cytochrome) subunit [Azoarcus sp. KH32C]
MKILKSKKLRASVLVLATSLSAFAANALEIALPPDTATYKQSDLSGYRLAQQNCLICHSAQYVAYQPPSSPRGYWDATVKKMKKVFGAPVADEDIPEIVDYLVKTYGAEQTQTARTSGTPVRQAN